MTNISQVRQNFHEDCEDGINKQINMELYASYVYLALVCILCKFVIKCNQYKCNYFSIFRHIILIVMTLH